MNRLSTSIYKTACGVILALCSSLHSFDNFHFYRASYFVGEPRFEKRGLSSFDIIFGAGATCQARNCAGYTTDLLNIYGPFNMQALGIGVPGKSMTNPVDIALTNLALLPRRDCFGNLLYKGHFAIQELILQYTQNIACGFFFQTAVPFRHVAITNVTSVDLSPDDGQFPNVTTPAWQTFLNLFPEVMARYGLNVGATNQKGPGDTTLYLGWANTYQDTALIDFIDTEILVGLLLPTGVVRNPSNVFEIDLGYGGHYGIPIQFNASVGSFDWLTFGGHIGGIAFFNTCKNLRMKTDGVQNGLIKLASGDAVVKKGNLWHTGAFAKADHFCRGLSFLVSYSYAHQRSDSINACDKAVFTTCAVNSDGPFLGWSIQTLNFIVDYDFTQEGYFFGPRVSLFYNREITGKRTFNTSIGGGSFGVDTSWYF